MPKPAHARLTWSGTFGSTTSPAEIWAFGLNTEPLDVAVFEAQTLVAALSTAWSTHLSPIMSTDVALTNVRAAAVAETGLVQRTAAGAYMQRDSGTSDTGDQPPSVGTRMPISTALCVSLMTPRAGVTGKGRFFLPFPAQTPIEADFRISTSRIAALADACKGFVNAVNAATAAAQPGGTLSGQVVVASGGSVIEGLPPTLTQVTGIRVGRVPDTMRSRRGALREGYEVRTL